MRSKILLGLALACAAVLPAGQAWATGSVRLEYLKGTFVYDAETVSASGASVQSTKNVTFGGRGGTVRVYGISGAVIVTPAGANPTATQTNGFRMQSCSAPIEIPIQPGEKLAIIEAADASSCAGGGSVTASTTVSSTAADPTYTEGGTTGQLSTDLTGYLRVKAKQSGAWSVGLTGSLPAFAATPAFTISGTLPAFAATPPFKAVDSGGTDATDTTNHAIKVNVVAGGAGGGAVTVADGADVTQGAKADSAWTTGSGSVIALLKAIAAAAIDTTTASPVKIDQTSTNNNVVVASSALPSGAATSAIQSETHGTVAAGTAATKSELTGCVFNTSLPTLTTGQQAANQCDSTGHQFIVAPASDTKLDTLHADMATAIPTGSNVIGGTYPAAQTTGGLSTCRVVTGTTGFCKASAGTAFHVIYQNTNAAVRYIHIYNKASAPTLGTDTPIATVQMALTSRGEADFSVYGLSGAAGIAWAVTTDDIAIPTTAGTSGDLHMTLLYK